MKGGTEGTGDLAFPNAGIFHSLPICKPPTLISNGFSPVVLHLSEHARRRMDAFCSIC